MIRSCLIMLVMMTIVPAFLQGCTCNGEWHLVKANVYDALEEVGTRKQGIPKEIIKIILSYLPRSRTLAQFIPTLVSSSIERSPNTFWVICQGPTNNMLRTYSIDLGPEQRSKLEQSVCPKHICNITDKVLERIITAPIERAGSSSDQCVCLTHFSLPDLQWDKVSLKDPRCKRGIFETRMILCGVTYAELGLRFESLNITQHGQDLAALMKSVKSEQETLFLTIK